MVFLFYFTSQCAEDVVVGGAFSQRGGLCESGAAVPYIGRLIIFLESSKTKQSFAPRSSLFSTPNPNRKRKEEDRRDLVLIDHLAGRHSLVIRSSLAEENTLILNVNYQSFFLSV